MAEAPGGGAEAAGGGAAEAGGGAEAAEVDYYSHLMNGISTAFDGWTTEITEIYTESISKQWTWLRGETEPERVRPKQPLYHTWLRL